MHDPDATGSPPPSRAFLKICKNTFFLNDGKWKMNTVYILTHGFRYSTASVVGVFSSMENARQRQKEILSNMSKDLYPDFFRIDSITLDVGTPVTEEYTQFDHQGNMIP